MRYFYHKTAMELAYCFLYTWSKRGVMQDRRKEERKTLVAYTQVFDLYGGNLLGYLGDLTVSGAMIISEKAMKPDTEITLSIELPEMPEVKAIRMSMLTRVAWCEQDLSPQYFNIGFEQSRRGFIFFSSTGFFSSSFFSALLTVSFLLLFSNSS